MTDTRGVGWRLEQQRSLVFVSEFFTEGEQRVFPIVDFIRGYVVKGEVAVEVLLATGEGDAEIGGLQGIHAGSELIFLWQSEAHGHLIHRPLVGNETGKAAGVSFLSGEEGEWIGHLIGVGEGEVEGVEREQVVEVGGAAAPVTEYEKRWAGKRRGADRCIEPTFFSSGERVETGGCGDEDGTVPVSRAHRIFPQQVDPAIKGDAGEVVVGDRPSVLEDLRHIGLRGDLNKKQISNHYSIGFINDCRVCRRLVYWLKIKFARGLAASFCT